jgi:hypothetical protein
VDKWGPLPSGNPKRYVVVLEVAVVVVDVDFIGVTHFSDMFIHRFNHTEAAS